MTGLEVISHFKTFKGKGRTFSLCGENLVIPVVEGGKLTSIEVTKSSIQYIVWGSPHNKGCRSMIATVQHTGKVTFGESNLAKISFR